MTTTADRRADVTLDIPEFVKRASLFPADVIDALPGSAFADPTRREYACPTAADTWLSAAEYVEKNASASGPVWDAIKRTAEFFGISEHLPQPPTEQKTAAEEAQVDYLVSYEAFGRRHNYLPLRNESEIKAAADWLLAARSDLVYTDRRDAAAKLLKAAAHYSEPLPLETYGLLQQMAGDGLSERGLLSEQLERRADMVKDAVFAGPLLAVRDTLQQDRNLNLLNDGWFQQKLAAAIDEFDRHFKLPSRYGTFILPPESCVYAVPRSTIKAAAEQLIELPNGEVYDRADLLKLSAEHIEDWLGQDALAAVSDDGLLVSPVKLAAFCSQLTGGQAELFAAALHEAGAAPRLRTEPERPRVTAELLDALV